MGWIGGGPTRYDTYEDVRSAWDSTYGDIPTRTARSNSLVYVGEFKSEKDALAALKKRDVTGMGYAKIRLGKKSASIKNAEALLEKEQKKFDQFLVNSNVYKTHSGKTVGCKDCGSSFPRGYFKMSERYFYNDELLVTSGAIVNDGYSRYVNVCPVCGHDMRSKTTMERIAGYKNNMEKYRQRVKDLEKAEKEKSYFIGIINAYCG